MTGELLGGRDHLILSGVWSARMSLKQQNEDCQNLLARYRRTAGRRRGLPARPTVARRPARLGLEANCCAITPTTRSAAAAPTRCTGTWRPASPACGRPASRSCRAC